MFTRTHELRNGTDYDSGGWINGLGPVGRTTEKDKLVVRLFTGSGQLKYLKSEKLKRGRRVKDVKSLSPRPSRGLPSSLSGREWRTEGRNGGTFTQKVNADPLEDSVQS